MIALFVALLAITIMFFTVSIALIVTSLDPEQENNGNWWRQMLKNSIGAFFCVILVIYVFALTMLIIRLKQRVPDYYQQQKKQLIIVSCSLVLSLISKVTLRYIFYNKAFVKYWNDSRVEHTWFYAIFMFSSFYLEYFSIYISVLLSMR
jgi:hypothetical protein